MASFDDLEDDSAPATLTVPTGGNTQSPLPQAPSTTPASLPSFDSLESDEDKYGGLGSQLGTAAESAASTLSFGTSRGAEALAGKALGIPALSGEAQRGREAQNPISNVVGQVGALVGSEGLGALGTGAKAITGAGKIASAGIESRALAGAIRFGVENALIQGGNEVGKLVTDAPQTAGTAAVNIGLAGLMGGVLGGATGGLSSLWAARNGSKVASALDSAADAVSGSDVAAGGDAAAAPAGAEPSVNPESVGPDRAAYLKSLDPNEFSTLKENAPEIQDALDRLNIKATPGVLSADKTVQNVAGNLAERASPAGVSLNRARQAGFNKLAEAGKSTLDDATTLSKADIGGQVKGDMSKTLTENLKPIEEGYKAAEPELKSVPVGDDLKIEAIDPIANHDYVKLDPASANLAKTVSGQIQSIENLSDLKKVRTLISSQLNEAYGSGQGAGPKAQILQTAKNSLTAIRDRALDAAATNGDISADALANIRSLDAQYAAFQNTVKQLGVEGGLGKANNARALLGRFNDLSDESFAGRAFDSGDVRARQFMKDNFPEAFDKARRFKLSEIQDASIDHTPGANGRFSTSKYLTQVRAIKKAGGVEALQDLFKPEDLQKVKDIELVHKAIPGAQNTSNTSYAQTFGHFLSPSGLLNNLTDTAQLAWLHMQSHLNEAASLTGGDSAAKLGALKFAANVDKGTNPTAFKSMVDYIRATSRGQSTLNDAVGNLFDASKGVIPSHLIPDQTSRDKLEKTLLAFKNPGSASNVAGEIGHYLPDHATAIAQTSAAASNYLNALKPTQPVTSPLDATPPIDPSAQSKYNRALDVAQQPLMALKYTKDGTLLPQDVATLQTIYPGLHSSLVQKITNQMIEHKAAGGSIPYAQRVSLNMLMGGNPLDGTMTPQAMQSIMHSAAGQTQPSQEQAHKSQGKQSSATLSQLNKVSSLYQTPLEARAANKRS